MTRLPRVPLVPGGRGGAVLDAELPPLSREELEAILKLVGASQCRQGAEGRGAEECCPTCSGERSRTGSRSWL
jgi:hypothetical protein